MTDAIHAQTSKELGITREASVARMVAGIPLGRIETVDEVADAIEYLLSDRAGYVTGQALNVCGGIEFDRMSRERGRLARVSSQSHGYLRMPRPALQARRHRLCPARM